MTKHILFTPQPLRAVRVLFSPMVSRWAAGIHASGQREKVCPGYISETVKCWKLLHGRDIAWKGRCGGVGGWGGGCRCATLGCDFDLTFDLAIVTLTCKILSGLYLGNLKV